MNPIQNYLYLRNKGLSRKTAKSCVPELAEFMFVAKRIVFWSLLLGALMYWTSDYAAADAEQKLSEQTAYSKALEDLTAKCLTKEGGTYTIERETFWCSSYSLGEFRK